MTLPALEVCFLNGEVVSSTGPQRAELIRNWLSVSNAVEINLHDFDVTVGRFPRDHIQLYDAFIVGGSPQSAYNLPSTLWIKDLAEVLKEINKEKKKIFGICFGHQIIGQTFGGTVTANLKGRQVTKRTVTLHQALLIAEDDVKPVPTEIDLLVTHGDIVSHLPKGAQPIGTSSMNLHEGFILGGNILTIQGHPEFGASKNGRATFESIRRNAVAKGKIKDEGTDIGKTDDRFILDLMLSYFLRDMDDGRKS